MARELSTDGRLTDVRYWENVWGNKGARAWTDLAWVRSRYHWVVWDRVLRERLRPDPRARFLEVGCGTGKWLVYFHRVFGYAVTGCDYSDAGCNAARRNLELAGIPGDVIQEDCFALRGQYEVVCSLGLIEHFRDTRSILAKFASLLTPGGTLISMVPNLTGLSGAYHRLLKPETFDTHRSMTMDDLRRWHAELGFTRIEVGALGSVVPMRFPRDKVRKRHPRFYRVFWKAFLQPLTWATDKGCTWGFSRWGTRLESERFSPYLYVIADKA